jgi:hypothetical protein
MKTFDTLCTFMYYALRFSGPSVFQVAKQNYALFECTDCVEVNRPRVYDVQHTSPTFAHGSSLRLILYGCAIAGRKYWREQLPLSCVSCRPTFVGRLAVCYNCGATRSQCSVREQLRSYHNIFAEVRLHPRVNIAYNRSNVL